MNGSMLQRALAARHAGMGLGANGPNVINPPRPGGGLAGYFSQGQGSPWQQFGQRPGQGGRAAVAAAAPRGSYNVINPPRPAQSNLFLGTPGLTGQLTQGQVDAWQQSGEYQGQFPSVKPTPSGPGFAYNQWLYEKPGGMGRVPRLGYEMLRGAEMVSYPFLRDPRLERAAAGLLMSGYSTRPSAAGTAAGQRPVAFSPRWESLHINPQASYGRPDQISIMQQAGYNPWQSQFATQAPGGFNVPSQAYWPPGSRRF